MVLTTAVCLLTGALGVADAAASPAPGLLRVAHFSPDTPALDVAVAPVPDGRPLTDAGPVVGAGLHYGDVGAYRRLPPGTYAVSLRAAGAGRGTPPVLSARVEVPAGGARTVAVTGRFAALTVQVLPDDISAPPTGKSRVRVIDAAAGPGALDATVTGAGGRPAPLASGLSFPGTGQPSVLPAGAARLRLTAGGAATDLPVDLAAGSVVSLVVLDRPAGGLVLRVVVDAAGPAVSPRGPVEAGAGGTAGPSPATLTAGLALCALAAVAGVRGRRRVVLAAVGALVLAAVGPAAAAAPSAPAGPHALVPLVATVAERPVHSAPPSRVRVPSVGVDTAAVPIGLDERGELIPPRDTARVGWFRPGPAPGDTGPAVFAGHVDSSAGPGAFFRIGRVATGDPVLVTRADGSTLRFRVTRVARFPKTAFPAAEVYGPTPDAELRLITCGGRFDRSTRSYVDNVVVFAALDGPAD